MSTVQSYLVNIEKQLKLVCSASKFKGVTFGDTGKNIEYPSIHFVLEERDHFDDVHLVNTTMQLRWELVYKVHVLHAGLSNPSTWAEAIESVNIASELFVNQIPATKRLSGHAWWIEPSNVIYGSIEVDSAIDQNGVMGGTFDLNIKFLQDV